jgi:hypothetical protein
LLNTSFAECVSTTQLLEGAGFGEAHRAFTAVL